MNHFALFAGMAGLFGILLVAEHIVPLRERKRSFVGRLIVNLLLAAVAFVIAASLVTPVALAVTGWASGKPFGLIHLLPLPGWARAALGFLLMDLAFYYWHVANHRVPFLWRFHNVHHIDPDLDISTALRFHWGEMLLSTGFRAAQVGLIGVTTGTYFFYEIAFQANTLIHHSNVRLPIGIERLLNKFLVTPRMHGIHHSTMESEANSNYSVVLSLWDRLHRSLRLNIPQASIVVGVPAYLDPEDNRFWNAFFLPFQKQRDHWLFPDGSRALRPAAIQVQERDQLLE